MPLLFAVGVYIFLMVGYRYHVYFQEQFQLFEFTGVYFLDTVGIPGGFADWLGRFLTQFCYYAWSGALIIVLLLVGIRGLIRSLSRKGTAASVLSFIPVIALLIFICDAEAMASASVAMLLTLCCASLALKINDRRASAAVIIIATPVLYFLLGPLSVLFPVVTALCKKHWKIAAACFLLLAAVIVISHIVWGYPYYRLLYGVNYYRLHHHLSVWLWVAAALSVITIAAVPLMRRCVSCGRTVAAFACVLALTALSLWLTCDFAREKTMKYDFLARRGLWNQIIREAGREVPDSPATMNYLNLALAMTGQMGNKMFQYPQNGEDGLMQELVTEYNQPLPASEVCFYIGMINDAKRFSFEMQESVPDFQKSARLYKRLAETNLINGSYEAARKYLKPLKNTIFYKNWAEEVSKLLGNDNAVMSHPLYGHLSKSRIHGDDFMFNRQSMESMLASLVTENPENYVALEYLLSWAMLTKDLDGFVYYCPVDAMAKLPVHWQEAYLTYMYNKSQTYTDIPAFISQPVFERFTDFVTDMGKGLNVEQIRRKYVDTYWFYYSYYNPEEKQK